MSRFDKLRSSVSNVVEELQIAMGTPDPRSVDHRVNTVTTQSRDKHIPDRDKMQRYWKLYHNVPIVRQPIRSFASEVIGPGYYIETDNEEAKEDLEEWLSQCAIVGGEVGKDFRFLLKKATIQREVKGTAFSEKVETEENDFYGFKLIRPETMRAFTRPGQSVLLAPDEDIEKINDNSKIFLDENKFFTTKDGEVAAYVQLLRDFRGSSVKSGHYIAFPRDKIIKLSRDADIGEVFGESRLAAIEERLESLLKKLEDNDKAIESLAHPYLLFKMGVDEPWEPGEIKQFTKEHEQDSFEPGMKQAVQGDIDVESVSGEVAPIEEFLNFDVNWIISEMPLPKYALGGFEEDVNQFVSRSQETRVEKQIQEARDEIESEWTPHIEEKAKEMGYEDAEVELVIGDDPEDLNLVEKEEDEGNTGASGTNFTRPAASTEPEREDNGDQE